MTTRPNIASYRRIVTLKDGARVLIRPMTANDSEGLIELYASAQPDDLRSIRDDVSDPNVVRAWADLSGKRLSRSRAGHGSSQHPD
jgi:hypothetical protein